ncbi:hypothetical protein [Nocardia salmonicida]|uniref:hypothetical protein n=1 Tax=Nocardia salmonicida TaxID=53431 RepID=UPI000B1F2A2C
MNGLLDPTVDMVDQVDLPGIAVLAAASLGKRARRRDRTRYRRNHQSTKHLASPFSTEVEQCTFRGWTLRRARYQLSRRSRAREDDRRTNLRAELTEFVGKFGDIAVVRKLIAEHRLTTLTGPGGSGKPTLRDRGSPCPASHGR